MKKVLFVTATQQNTVNTSNLDYEGIQPDLVCVAITEGMLDQGQSLVNELKGIGKKVEVLNIHNEHSLQSLTQQYENWIAAHEDEEIIVNLTGGFKLMAIAAYQVFSSYGFRCFYQDRTSNHVMWLDDESIISNVGHNIGLERYLKSYHFDVCGKQNPSVLSLNYKKYTKILFEELTKAGRYESTCAFITRLNACAHKPDLQPTWSDEEKALLEHLHRETGLLELNGRKVVWETKEDQIITTSGWLEVLGAEMLKGGSFRDIHLSVEIAKSTQRKSAKTLQEIDVMAMQGAKLVIIECKIVNWKDEKGKGQTGAASEAIYKLSALSDIGGLNTKPVFISLYDLPDAAKTRAAEHGISVIAGCSDILSIKKILHTI